jgi:hypothetical protein
LLLATSFLGLRRYLRQRKLEMPLEMTATWIALGVALIFATLLAASILPRPHAEYSLTQLPVVFTSAVRRASRLATGKEGTEDQSNDRAAKTDAEEGQEAQQGDKTGKGTEGQTGEGAESGKSGSQEGKSKSNDGDQDGKSQGNGKESDSSGSKQKADQGGKFKSKKGESNAQQKNDSKGESADDSSPADKQNETQDRRSAELAKSDSLQQPTEAASRPTQSAGQMMSNIARGLGTLLHWFFYLALVIAAAVLGWIYRAELLAAWNKLLAELRELWPGWFGGKKEDQVAAESQRAAAPPRPFASFADPFISGAARQMSWPELVRYTFEAAEAWGREHNAPRQADQTPHEFAVALGQVEPQVGPAAQTLAAWYSQLAYAPRSGATGSVAALQQLWRALSAASAPPPIAIPHA